jgi:hypothetical protein
MVTFDDASEELAVHLGRQVHSQPVAVSHAASRSSFVSLLMVVTTARSWAWGPEWKKRNSAPDCAGHQQPLSSSLSDQPDRSPDSPEFSQTFFFSGLSFNASDWLARRFSEHSRSIGNQAHHGGASSACLVTIHHPPPIQSLLA